MVSLFFMFKNIWIDEIDKTAKFMEK